MNDQPKTPPKAEGWEAELDELELRRAEAQKLGGAEAVAKHHAQGRLTIRERIAGLVDPGSFQEVGGLTGQGRYEGGKLKSVTPAPYVMGVAAIDGRPAGQPLPPSAAMVSSARAAATAMIARSGAPGRAAMWG